MLCLRALGLSAILFLASCGSMALDSRQAAPPKVILGATLIDGTGRPPIPDALVLVELGNVVIASSSKGIQIPANAVRTNATGLFIVPTQMGARLEYGAPADLFLLAGSPLENPLLLANPMRVMRSGEWMDASKR